MRVKAYLSLFRVQALADLQYRLAALAGATTSIFWGLVEIVIFTVFYTYSERAGAGIPAGLSLNQVVTYVWLAQCLFSIQPLALDSEIQAKIENGNVSLDLARPMDLYAYWFAKIAAGRLTPLCWRGLAVLAAGIVMPAGYRLGPPASWANLLWTLAAAASALFLAAAFGCLLSSVRLSVDWGSGPVFMLILVSQVLSGSHLPLQLWPKAWQRWLFLQPFAGYLDIPCRMYLGSMPLEQAAAAIALQWLWIVVFVIVGRLLMARQLARIVVQGG
ncbi:MAG: ABC-2 family transporter protein [Limnochordia bacterium]|jgi:ABC-2 type transport system permease protein|nr:ABC-2 family transporter protein [Bacillota bacterium]NLH31972.1 hypothetical protein [Bacillota bacterium]